MLLAAKPDTASEHALARALAVPVVVAVIYSSVLYDDLQ